MVIWITNKFRFFWVAPCADGLTRVSSDCVLGLQNYQLFCLSAWHTSTHVLSSLTWTVLCFLFFKCFMFLYVECAWISSLMKMKKLRNSWTLLLHCNFWVILELICFLYKVYWTYAFNLVYKTAFYFALYILILDKNLWMESHKLIHLSLDDRKVHFSLMLSKREVSPISQYSLSFWMRYSASCILGMRFHWTELNSWWIPNHETHTHTQTQLIHQSAI